MLTAALNLPKWLLASVVFCVLLGHLGQIECRLTGCSAFAADACAKAPVKGDPAPASGDSDHCDCQCHSSAATCELPRPFAVWRYARPVATVEWQIAAPEAPRVEIEYPPRVVHA